MFHIFMRPETKTNRVSFINTARQSTQPSSYFVTRRRTFTSLHRICGIAD